MVSLPQQCPSTGAAADSSDYYNGVDLPPSESESEYEYGSEGGSDNAGAALEPQRPQDAAVEPGRAVGDGTSDFPGSSVPQAAVAIMTASRTDAEEAAASGGSLHQAETAACNVKLGCDPIRQPARIQLLGRMC